MQPRPPTHSLTHSLGALWSHVDQLCEQIAPTAASAAASVQVTGSARLADSVSLADPMSTYLELRQIAQRLEASALALLPQIEAEGLWALDGARSFPQWLAAREHTSTTAARRQSRLARALRDELPRTATALAKGDLTMEHAGVLATVAATSDQRREVLRDDAQPCNETFLVQQAGMLGVDRFRRLTRRWAAAADPEADERGFRDAADREFFDVARTTGGYHLAGFLTPEHGTVLATALRSAVGVPAVDDDRTAGQRRAHGLVDLSRLALDHGLTGTGSAVRPHLSVHVGWAALSELATTTPAMPSPQEGPAAAPGTLSAELEDCTPIPATVLQRIACDSTVTRVVFGPDSQVLDVGRTQRIYTGQLRRAVIARDRHCSYPGCEAPPALGEIHHVVHWMNGGATSVENGVLLCWHHHEWVHQRKISISRSRASWHFQRVDGSRVCAVARRSTREGPGPGPGP